MGARRRYRAPLHFPQRSAGGAPPRTQRTPLMHGPRATTSRATYADSPSHIRRPMSSAPSRADGRASHWRIPAACSQLGWDPRGHADRWAEGALPPRHDDSALNTGRPTASGRTASYDQWPAASARWRTASYDRWRAGHGSQHRAGHDQFGRHPDPS